MSGTTNSFENATRVEQAEQALKNPYAVVRELNNRSLYHFLEYFWPLVSTHPFVPNWHIELLCSELEKVAGRVGKRKPKEYDLIINVPPGTTKTITCSIMFPAWCWTKWHWMRFITASYSATLSLESADYHRNMMKSELFAEIYPDLSIMEDKDTKTNFRVIKKVTEGPGRAIRLLPGGMRYSTSVGGTLTGFHGDLLLVDDPINPQQSASDLELANANRWLDQTLPTRKTDKAISTTILIMQRLHQDDPSGHTLAKQKENIRHFCLPGEIRSYGHKLNPPELKRFYQNDLLDPHRLSWAVLKDLEADLGQYGYAGQIGQDPTPPGGGMFKVDNFIKINTLPTQSHIACTIRYWDKAGSEGAGAYTVGVKTSRLTNGKWIVEDVKRGRWGSAEREAIIKSTAEADGRNVEIWIEQEPGSGGKESAEGTIRNLAGFVCYAEKPTGDKVFRADPYSVQVNNGNFLLLNGEWNHDFIEEHRFFPYSTYKDQVDASGGAFNKLVEKKIVRCIS